MGAPLGNQNAANAKKWKSAVERCLESWPDEPSEENCSDLVRGLNKAAFAFVGSMMATKDIAFFREFGDRIDGKPKQETEFSGDLNVHGLAGIIGSIETGAGEDKEVAS